MFATIKKVLVKFIAMDLLNFNDKPLNRLRPAAGKVLIAGPFLADPNFARSVILLCEHGADGTIGFVLNRLANATIGDLLPELFSSDLPVYQGGPVQLDTLHMLHRMPSLIMGGNEILPGTYWGGSYEALQDVIINNKYEADDLRLFVGYSGWAAGQLERELEEGSWIVADVAPDLLFDTHPTNTWKAAIRSLGDDYAYLANMPIDPQLN